MSIVGPQLPPHLLAKRKRQQEEEAGGAQAQAGVEHTEPMPIKATSTTAPQSRRPDGPEKRQRTVGPSMPTAPIEERPSAPLVGDEESSSSDDEMGPALPPAPGQSLSSEEEARRRVQEEAAVQALKEQANKPQREDWMLVPPKQDDWSARVDPTKLRNRKFNTGKGSKAPAQQSGADSALWTETPEQKRKRLDDEIMGIKQPATETPLDSKTARDTAEADDTTRRIREYNDKNRNSSLYSDHKKTVPREKEDDPSKRAFDKEKDIGLGQKIGHAKRRELLTKAADFGSKFAGGKYL